MKHQKNKKQPSKPTQAVAVVKPPSIEAILKNPQGYQVSQLFDTFSNRRVARVCYEAASGLGEIPRSSEDKRPEWALEAWKAFARSLGMFSQDGTHEAKEMGTLVGIFSTLKPDSCAASPDISKLFSVSSEMVPQLRILAAQASPTEAADFFSSQKAGQGWFDRMSQLSQRTKIFLLIALAWEAVAECKSAGELFRCLYAETNDRGQPLLARSTEAREIREICEIIGLRYNNRGGRPPRKPGAHVSP